jgi:hypothetical protein
MVVTAFAGCSAKPDTFVVEDPERMARSAVLKLCGIEKGLKRQKRELTVTAATPCAERGEITVTYNDGRTADCLIGLVSQEATYEWRFRLHTSWCEELSANAGVIS